MTAKELRDKKVDCRKVYCLLEAKSYLISAGEHETTELVRRAIKDIKVGYVFFIWNSLFRAYNQENDPKFNMACMICWDKVLDWAIKNEKIDE